MTFPTCSLHFIWLGPVVDESTMHRFPAVSPAANRWQQGLLRAMEGTGASAYCIGHVPEPVWPKGRFRMQSTAASLAKGLDGSLTSYWNVPVFRGRSVAKAYQYSLEEYYARQGKPSFLLAYNASPANNYLGVLLKKRFSVPWIVVVADAEAPKEADGFVFLSWGYYSSFECGPKLHLDGGVSRLPLTPSLVKPYSQKRIVLYSGAMNQYGGVELLVQAFQRIRNQQAELWLCGKGNNLQVDKAAAVDSRIKVLGFVSDEKLDEFSRQADLFVNPRPSSIPGNENNFPSKVLEYLSYGKPVVSTWTAGLAPEYRNVLVVAKEETPACLANAIEGVLAWGSDETQTVFSRIRHFLETRKTWQLQANRLLDWLMESRFSQ